MLSARPGGRLSACRLTWSAAPPSGLCLCAVSGLDYQPLQAAGPPGLPVPSTPQSTNTAGRRLESSRCAPGTVPSSPAKGALPTAVSEGSALSLRMGSCCLGRRGDWHIYGRTGPSQTWLCGGHSQEQLGSAFESRHSPRVSDFTLQWP